MKLSTLAGPLLALAMAACAPAPEGEEATTAPAAPAAGSHEEAVAGHDHGAGGSHMEGMGPWTQVDEGYAFTVTVTPSPPAAGEMTISVAVTDPSGDPVLGLDLGYDALDVDAGRVVHQGGLESTVPGVYTVDLELGASAWKLTLHADVGGADRHAVFEVDLS